MAARRIYASPPEQMVRLAAAARANGLSFDVWWERAVRPGRPPILTTTRDAPPGVVHWPSDSAESREWRDATEEMKDSWRRAFERIAATRSDRAVARLEPLLRVATARAVSRDAAA